MITWTSKAWIEFIEVCVENRRTVKRVIKLIEDIERNGYTGIGKPEALKGDLSGYWSRRIDNRNRLVYKIESGDIKIVQCGTHYHDK